MKQKVKMKEIFKNRILQAFLGFFGILALTNTISFQAAEKASLVPFTNSFAACFMGIAGIAAFLYVCNHMDWEEKRGIVISSCYSLLFSFCLLAGKYLETVENVPLTNISFWANLIMLTTFLIPFVKYGLEFVEKVCQREKGDCCPHFIRNWIIIFLCWIPVFLAFCPGAFVYDAWDEFIMVDTGQYTTHHPLLHVLLLGKMVYWANQWFGSYNLGIAAYTGLQMIVLSGIFSYTVSYITRKTRSKTVEKIAILFYGFFPVIPMYAVCSAKDGLFNGAFLVLIIQMLKLFDKPEEFLSNKKSIFATILAGTLALLLRNNAIYAYLVWIPLGIISFHLVIKNTNRTAENHNPMIDKQSRGKKNQVIKATIIMIAIFITYFAADRLLITAVHADVSESQEIMTVPIQQMARVYKYEPGSISEQDKETLYRILPEEELHLYNPRLSDLLKSKFNNENFNKDKTKYLSLWLKIGLKNPLTYLNAWWMTSYGFWYPDAVINVYQGNAVCTFTYEDSSYFGFETEVPGYRTSLFPALEEGYRKMSLEIFQQKVPILSQTFSPGFLFWVFSFCMSFLLWKKNWKTAIPLLLILLLWLTVLLGPTYLVRYVLILWFALPLFVTSLKV